MNEVTKKLYDQFRKDSLYFQGEYIILAEREGEAKYLRSDNPSKLFQLYTEYINES